MPSGSSQPSVSSKPSNGPYFTFDDVPVHKWRDKILEFIAWLEVQQTKPGAQFRQILREFAARFTEPLQEWFISLGEYRQLQFYNHNTVAQALGQIHWEFLGDEDAIRKERKKELHDRKCCSLKPKDLEYHYKLMFELFYEINGINHTELRHVFAASLPEEIQPELLSVYTSRG